MSDDDNNRTVSNQHEEEDPVLNTLDNNGEQRSSSHQRPPSHAKAVWKGIGLLVLLHLLLFVFPAAFFFISVAQLIYLIPALIFFRKNKGIFQGLLIGAGVTLLLNAACFGLLISKFGL
jgi:hypothetical protein